MENGQPVTCVDAGLPQLDLSQLAASIRFAHVEHPLVSVLVIGQDGSLLAGRTLQGLAQQKRREEVEVFLLPVGMSANDIETFSGIDGLGVLEEREFPAEWETVARLPLRGEYVFVVKGGVVVADDCLDALLSTLERHADCAMAGPKSVRATGELKEAGTVVGCDGAIEAYGAGGAPERSDCNYVREVDACGDAALLIRKASLVAATEGLGGLTRRVPWIELAFELRAAGGRTVYQPKARVVDERTDASGDGEATARLGDRWTALPDFRRDGRGPKKTILVVDHAVPQPDRDAGSRSMWHFMRMFQCRGFDVKFWPHDQRHDAVYVELLQQHGIEVLLGHQGGFPAWFARHAADLHSVLLSRPHVALEYLSLVRRHASTRLPLLYYGHDIHYMRLGAQLKHASSPELERQVAQHVAWEQAIWPAVDVVYYPAGNETELVRAWLLEHGHRHVTARTIPVYAFDSVPEVSRRDLAERKGIMFVGGFAHAPNADAAKWFAHEVMPLVVKEHPDAKLYLLGSNPTSEIRALSSRHVTVVGYVTEDELVDYYAKMRLSVAPLRFGAGMKGKVIEAMRHGLPCVMTSVGAQGLEDASFLAVADDPKSFAEQVVRFLGDDEYWAANSASSQRLVRERFSEQALWNVVRQDLEDGRPYGA
jgi:glycosyltransferase involved in cell wall biosynthesis